MHILLIEPDNLLAKLYADALTTTGHQVDAVDSTQAALTKLDGQKVDLILLELDIPDHNGLEFLYEFISYEDWQVIPIYILSHLPPDSFGKARASWRTLGVERYLYKPSTTLAGLQQIVGGRVVP